MDLRLFHNGNDYIAAESPDDAAAIYEQHVGDGIEYDPDDLGDFAPVESSKLLTFTEDDCDKLTLTAEQWVSRCGRAFIASKDY